VLQELRKIAVALNESELESLLEQTGVGKTVNKFKRGESSCVKVMQAKQEARALVAEWKKRVAKPRSHEDGKKSKSGESQKRKYTLATSSCSSSKKQKTSRMPPKSEGTTATESVICVRKASLQTRGYTDLSSWLRNPAHTYIGRNMVFYVGPGAEHSKWANPFSVKKYGRDECLRMYREYVLTGVNPVTKKKRKGGALVGDIEELTGKALGCWCNPDPCHGDILVELLQNSVDEGKSD
jgi:hypothetical protein